MSNDVIVLPPWNTRSKNGWRVMPNGCHEWTGVPGAGGYGVTRYQGRNWRAHRLRYVLEVGPVPDGLVLDHFACDNPICCNPAHVRPATHRENTLRGTGPTAVNVRRTHCYKGHPLTPDNVRITREGWRSCRECSRAWYRWYHPKRRPRLRVRGICPRCGHKFALREDGTLQSHMTSRRKGSPRCDGDGMKPVAEPKP